MLTDFLYATPIRLPRFQSVQLWCVGVGGTGSYLAVQLATIAQSLIDHGIRASVHLCDPDWIEEKNTRRQNFSTAEIGCNKARAMTLRLSLCGKCKAPIYAYPSAFDPEWIQPVEQQIVVLVGCVDNASGRSAISSTLRSNDSYHVVAPKIWHIDAGNHHNSGQVLVGSSLNPDPNHYRFNALGCFRLPSPVIQHPKLLEDDPDTPSCEEAARLQDQSISVNPMSATLSATSVRLLLSGTLRYYATYFDLDCGKMTSRYIEEDRIIELVKTTRSILDLSTNKPCYTTQ